MNFSAKNFDSKKGRVHMKKLVIVVLTALLVFGLASVAMADTTGGAHINNPHQNFKANTDGCASCHTTHTAVGPKLLSGASTYITCTNCHNGTESVYDVKLGQVGSTDAATTTYTNSNAGLFEGNVTVGMAKSRHVADSGTNIDMANYGSNGNYSGTNIFTCAGCHDPHKKLADYSGNGTQYNARLLKVAPKVVYNSDSKAVLSNGAAGVPAGTGSASIVKSTNTASVLSGTWGYMNIYPQTPNLYIRTGAAAPYTYTVVDPSTYTFNATSGVFTFTSGYSTANTYVASYWAKAPLVTVSYSNYRVTTPNATAAEVATYSDTNFNNWCSTCHNDFGLSNDAKVAVGDYTMKYRHAVSKSDQGMAQAAKSGTFLPKINGVALTGASSINLPTTPLTGSAGNILCVTCHYAHGTKATSVVNSDNVTISTAGTANGATQASWTNTSRLLRYDNRDTCEACHQK